MSAFRYKAFISYSHHNSQIAARLLKKLEGYRVPAHLRGDKKTNTSAPNRLGKIFRDRDELPASGSLNSKLLDALRQAEFLIIICSPDAAKSQRVNEEISQFIKHRDSGNILCYIIEGTPEFGPIAGELEQDCVPPSLRRLYIQSGQIPVAADARDIGDGPSRARQKIIAGLLKVGLDELVQRDARRDQNRLMTVAAVSFGFALLTSGLLVRANMAEHAAQQAILEAQLQNERSEDLVHFMLDDLAASKLRQLGRMDVIDVVVEKVAAHYAQQDNSKLTSTALARKARAYLRLGWMYFDRNLHEPADALFEYAYKTTTVLTEKYPDSEEASLAHVTGLYWIGLSNVYRGRYDAAEKAWRERVGYNSSLRKTDIQLKILRTQMGDIHVHLGWSLMEQGRITEAYNEFRKGLRIRKALVDQYPDDIDRLNNLAGGYYHMQWAELYLGMNEQALKNAKISNDSYKELAKIDPLDQWARGNYARSLRWLAEAKIAAGKYSDAGSHLQESIAIHKELLDFEPEEKTFQYQSCVSSVMLEEVFLAVGQYEDAKRVFEEVCDRADEILALDHPVAHNRLYGYRHELIRIELQMQERRIDQATREHAKVTAQFEKETSEIRNSLLGRNIALALAIDAVELDNQLRNIPHAKQQLSDIFAKMGSRSDRLHSPTAKLLARAKQLSENVAGDIGTGSLSIEN